jgi:hypothetical protein
LIRYAAATETPAVTLEAGDGVVVVVVGFYTGRQ